MREELPNESESYSEKFHVKVALLKKRDIFKILFLYTLLNDIHIFQPNIHLYIQWPC